MTKTLLLATSLSLAASTITFDNLPSGANLHNYSEQGVTFNMSYGVAFATGDRMLVLPDGSYGYSFLTIVFDEPVAGSSVSFNLGAVDPDQIFVVQSYDPSVPGMLVEEHILFGSQFVELQLGNPTFVVIIDATPRGFTLDNFSFGGTSDVPEPRSITAVGVALVGLILIGRKAA